MVAMRDRVDYTALEACNGHYWSFLKNDYVVCVDCDTSCPRISSSSLVFPAVSSCEVGGLPIKSAGYMIMKSKQVEAAQVPVLINSTITNTDRTSITLETFVSINAPGGLVTCAAILPSVTVTSTNAVMVADNVVVNSIAYTSFSNAFSTNSRSSIAGEE